jgi:hypothetical protein
MMELSPLPAAMGEHSSSSAEHPGASSAAGYDLRIQHARLIPDPQRIWSWEWLRHQIYTINWTNIALIITVIAVSSNIQSQLRQQEDANATTRDQIVTLQQSLSSANVLIDQLHADVAVARSFNASLQTAIALGYMNLTDRIVALDAKVARSWLSVNGGATAAGSVVSLAPVEQVGQAVELAPSGYSAIVRQPGTYLVWFHYNFGNGAAAGAISVNTTQIVTGVSSESQHSTICGSVADGSRVTSWNINGASAATILDTSTIATFTQEQMPLYVQACIGTVEGLQTESISPNTLWLYKLA